MKTHRKRREVVSRKGSLRRAAASVELALFMPILLCLIWGAIEACTMIYLKQSLTVAAYEGARTAIAAEATTESVDARCRQVLKERSVNDASIALDPADVAIVDIGQYITVTASAPCNANSVLPGWFFSNATLEGRATMMKELQTQQAP